MTEQEKKTVIKIVAAIGWADGSFDETEKASVTKTCTAIGIDESKIAGLLTEKTNIDEILTEIKHFSLPVVGQLLAFCYNMAMADGKLHDEEQSAIKKIAAQFWPEFKLDYVLNWLNHAYQAEQGYIELFALPVAKKAS